MRQIPFFKQLSYLFARAGQQDVMCSKVFHQAQKRAFVEEEDNRFTVYRTDRHNYKWAEARLALKYPEKYILNICSYRNSDQGPASEDSSYCEWQIRNEESSYFTRDEALRHLQKLESQWGQDGMKPLCEQPWAMRPVIATPF